MSLFDQAGSRFIRYLQIDKKKKKKICIMDIRLNKVVRRSACAAYTHDSVKRTATIRTCYEAPKTKSICAVSYFDRRCS